MNFFKNSKKKEIIALFFLYLVFFIIGVNSFKDYGISVDEWELRLMGFSNLKYILEILSYENIYELDKIAEIPELTEYLGTHGAIFALPMSFLEFFFGILLLAWLDSYINKIMQLITYCACD